MKRYLKLSSYAGCFLVLIALFGLFISCSEPVAINYFNASPTVVNEGQAVTLQWSVSGATRVNINNGIGDTAHAGTAIVTPDATTTYVLTATSSSQTLTREIPITVNKPSATGASQTDTSTGQNPASNPADQVAITPAELRYDNLNTTTDNYLSNQVAIWHTYAKLPASSSIASAGYSGDVRKVVSSTGVAVKSPLIILPLKDGMVCIVKNYSQVTYQYNKITSTWYDSVMDDMDRLNQPGWGLMTSFSPEKTPFKIQKINIAAVANHTGPASEYDQYHFRVRILDSKNKQVWDKVLPWSFFKSDTSTEVPPAFWKGIDVEDVTVNGDFSVEIMAESNDYSMGRINAFHYLAVAYERITGSKDAGTRSMISEDGKKPDSWVKLYDTYGQPYGYNLCIRVEGGYLAK
ncbi:MAG: hypothetical protein PHO26_02510 [Dehalococcoidia bacterium]|nr:hypothetical protein [Dehalococcoidia bacterium]MDD5494156.1 hypothetical protein [Dehalococcoidia bacterium]